MSQDCRERKYSNSKKYEKAEKTIDRDEDNLVLYLLTMENLKKIKKESLVC